MRLRLHAHAPLITLLPLHSDHTDAVELRTRAHPGAGGHTTTARRLWARSDGAGTMVREATDPVTVMEHEPHPEVTLAGAHAMTLEHLDLLDDGSPEAQPIAALFTTEPWTLSTSAARHTREM